MKYRTLTPKELETYQIGYKVGKHELFITDIEWESESEHQIYRKGYLAGCKDRNRRNIVNNVNNVNNVNSYIDTDTDIDTDIDTERKGGVGGKQNTRTPKDIINSMMNINKTKQTGAIEITKQFKFPNNEFFNAYRRQLPDATNRAETWIRNSRLVGKTVSQQKLGEIIRKFNKNQKNT